MENYSLLMGDISGDEDGGGDGIGVDGEAFRGHFPVRRRVGTETPVPQILASRWRRLWKVSRTVAFSSIAAACIRKAFRLHPIAPFNVPHVAITDTIVAGYGVPKASHLLLSRTGLCRNPTV
ncbi:hypothetical protein QYE76_056193 [Lolium multiflorum]|uniref:Uncharacterized protein n=1 Tax=Lolium multiflorum TaxID=4521 RepID=A0AAD8WML2_LOLMU|nr:hypothetical protein QYE76_056193 [Lolium multiflorum]